MKPALRALVATGLLAIAVPAIQAQQPGAAPAVKREIIPGSELMTSREREQYRQRIRGAKSAEEEARVREQHVTQMRERARLRGLQLPDTPKPDASP
jgi:hypothetical protein